VACGILVLCYYDLLLRLTLALILLPWSLLACGVLTELVDYDRLNLGERWHSHRHNHRCQNQGYSKNQKYALHCFTSLFTPPEVSSC
jgi:hypothetical protein